MSRPVVSVIIPTFNRAAILPRAIDSVLGQSYPFVEVLVVDDGSTDATPEVLRAYGDAIVTIAQENAGPSAARNRGIREARGDLIAFLDSDDVWLTTKLERQVDLLEHAGPDVPCCVCDAWVRTPDGRERNAYQISLLKLKESRGLLLNPAVILATRFVLFNQAVLIRRPVLVDCGGFDERLRFMEDHDLALRLAVRGPWAFIREPLVIWWLGSDNLSLTAAAQKQQVRLYQDIEYIDRKMLEREKGLDARARWCLQRHLQGVHRKLLAQRWAASGRVLARLGAKILSGWDRFQQACFRRSRSFPQAQTAPIDDPVYGGEPIRRIV